MYVTREQEDFEFCDLCGQELITPLEFDTGICDLCVEEDMYEDGDDYDGYIYE